MTTSLPVSWHRQSWESEPQYAAFCVYRDMPKPRSIDGAYRLYLAERRGLQPSDPRVAKKRTNGRWRDWSRGLNAAGKPIQDAMTWEDRVVAHDAHLEQEVEAQLEKRLVKERRRLIEDELEDYGSQLKKWREVRDRTLLHEQQKSARAKKKTGDTGETTGDEVEIIFAELNIKDWYMLTRWRKDISEQGRRVLGMPDKITQSQLTGDNGEPLAVMTLRVDDMVDILQALQKHKEQQRGSGS